MRYGIEELKMEQKLENRMKSPIATLTENRTVKIARDQLTLNQRLNRPIEVVERRRRSRMLYVLLNSITSFERFTTKVLLIVRNTYSSNFCYRTFYK